METWTDGFGVECDGVEYHKEITDRSGPVDITLFVGRKHYPKSGKDIVWHEVFCIENDDAHCRLDFPKARDALTGFASQNAENKCIKQLCTDEWGTCGWVTVQEMVAGHLRTTVRLDTAEKVTWKVIA